MRFILAILAAATLATPILADRPLSARDGARLEKRLAGRTAGKPISCIPGRQNMHVEQYGEQTLLYTNGAANSSPLYRNDPAGGCNQAGRGYAIVSRTTIGQVCSGDIIRVVDQRLGTDYGSCVLGRFTPYSRVRK